MTETIQFLVNHGLPIIFGVIFVEQLGLPLPAIPWLLAAGALAADGKFSLFQAIAVTVLACLLADGFWFYLGRFRGSQVLGLLCRISLEPDSCVRRTQNVFTRYGMRGVVVAKFLPGMSTVAPPLAGMAGISARRFFLYDGLGALLYGLCFVCLGYFFSSQIQQIGAALASIGGHAFVLLAGLAAMYIAYKYWQRRRILRELRMARITVDELRRKLDAGESPFILDLRSAEELQQDPSIIQGAIHTHLDDIEKRHHEFPRDRDIVLYCSCPNEESSARIALVLQRKGFTRVRPLLGGIEAWRKSNYPLALQSATVTATGDAAAASGQVPAVIDERQSSTGQSVW